MQMRYVLVLITVGAIAVAAQTQPPIDRDAARQAAQRADAALSKLEATVARLGAEKETRCMRSIGHSVFCGCLREHLPIDVMFDDYVELTGHTKPELEYSKQTQDVRDKIEESLIVRDRCTALAFPPTRGRP